jgi:hypothetical protein
VATNKSSRKRELLLIRIREQASQIEDLMSQLEAHQSRNQRPSNSRPGPDLSADLSRTELSPRASPVRSLVDISSPSSSGCDSHASRENSEWTLEARHRLEAFGGFIGLGGAGTSRSYFVEESLENSESSDDEYAYADANEIDSEDDGERKRVTDSPMASIPHAASPFGLMARVSAHVPRGKVGEGDNGNIGLAFGNLFRPPELEAFRPSADFDGHEVPSLLKESIITPKEAERLFDVCVSAQMYCLILTFQLGILLG